MNERQIKNLGYRYLYELKGDFSENFKYRFTEPSIGKMNYEVKINPIRKISIPNEVSKSKGFTISWEGLPLTENEGLAFLIQGGGLIQFQIKGKTETSEITIPAEKIKKFYNVIMTFSIFLWKISRYRKVIQSHNRHNKSAAKFNIYTKNFIFP